MIDSVFPIIDRYTIRPFGRPRERGMSLVEVMVVMVIIGIMALVGGLSFQISLSLNRVRNCAQNLALDIIMARSYAQSEGKRTVIELAPGAGTQDIDGDGIVEYYIIYLDNDTDGTYSAGDQVYVHGTTGDALCSDQIEIDSGTTIRIIKFNTLGSIIGGAANQNIYFKCNDDVTRLEIISQTGITRTYVNQDGCSGGSDVNKCTVTDDWVETN